MGGGNAGVADSFKSIRSGVAQVEERIELYRASVKHSESSRLRFRKFWSGSAAPARSVDSSSISGPREPASV